MTTDAKARIIVEATVAEAVRQFDQLAKSVEKVDKAAQESAKQMQAVQKTTQKMGLALMGAATAGGAFIFSATKLAARVETLGVVTATLGKNVGKTEEEIRSLEQAIVSKGITLQKSRESIAMMIQAEVDLAHATDLARLAQDTAVIANLDSSESFKQLIAVIQTGNIRMGRTLGLQLSFQGAYEKMAKSLGKSTQALTEQEKIQARTNEVLAQGATIAGTYEAAMTTAGKQMLSLNRHWEESRRIIGETFLPILSEAVTGITDLLESFEDLGSAQQRGIATSLGVGTAMAGLGGIALLATSQILQMAAAGAAVGIAFSTVLLPILAVGAALAAIVTVSAGLKAEEKERVRIVKEQEKHYRKTAKTYEEYLAGVEKAAKEQGKIVTTNKQIVVSTEKVAGGYRGLARVSGDYVDVVQALSVEQWNLVDAQRERASMHREVLEGFKEAAASAELAAQREEHYASIAEEVNDVMKAKRETMLGYADSINMDVVGAIDAFIKKMGFIASGADAVNQVLSDIAEAVDLAWIDAREGMDLAEGDLENLATAYALVNDEISRSEAIGRIAKEMGVDWGIAAKELDLILANLDAIPEEIRAQLQLQISYNMLGGAAGQAVRTWQQSDPYKPYKPTTSAPSGGRGGRQRQHGGSLGKFSVVGEAGWEYIMNGVVIPHRISEELKRLGISPNRGFATGGVVLDPGTGGGTSTTPTTYSQPSTPLPTSQLFQAPTTSEVAQAAQIAGVAAQQQTASQATFTMAITAEQAKATQAQRDSTKELKEELQEVKEQLERMNDMLPREIRDAVNMVVG
jgi:hypothetical protein